MLVMTLPLQFINVMVIEYFHCFSWENEFEIFVKVVEILSKDLNVCRFYFVIEFK